MEEGERTSRGTVSMPKGARAVSLEGLRAEANTRQLPVLWKAMARAEPRPPSEQPVMRTVRLGEAMFGMLGCCCGDCEL